MSSDLMGMLPQFDALSGAPPHQRSAGRVLPRTLSFFAAAAIPLVAGFILFGWDVFRVLAICLAICAFVEFIFRALLQRAHPGSMSNALLIGLLLTCTLPPTIPGYVAAIGSAIAVLVGLCLSDGLGHYLWHPVVIGRLAVQILFHDALTFDQWPVLARGHLMIGDLSNVKPLPGLWSWWSASPEPLEGWLVHRPVDLLHSMPIAPASEPSEGLAQLVGDHLPAWKDILMGGAGGAIGEAAVAALFIAALVLMWRGILRWPAVLAGLSIAAFTAAILPIQIPLTTGAVTYWLPGTAIWEGLPVGLSYVYYHLLDGGFLFVLFLLASDISSSPLMSRGHMIAAALLAFLTFFLRIYIGIPAAAYWALLIVNTLTPMINRLTRRRVYGT